MTNGEPFTRPETYRFCDWPKPLTLQDYEAALDRYLSRITAASEVVAVYQFGNVTVPGLSDLDLIVVFDGSLHQNGSLFTLRTDDNPENKQAFVHNPLFVTEQTWRGLQWVFAPQQIRRLYGKALPDPTPVPEKLAPYIAAATGIEYAVRQLHWLASMQVRAEIPVRKAISIVQSATYLGELAEQIGHYEFAHRLVVLRRRLHGLRTSWFKNPAPSRLLAFMKEILTLLISFNEIMACGILKFATADLKGPGWYLHSREAVSRFSDEQSDASEAVIGGACGRWLGQRLSYSLIRLPRAYGVHYMACSLISSNQGYGTMIRKRIRGDTSKPEWLAEAPAPYIEAMRRRMAVANGQLHFLRQNKFGCGYLVDYGIFDIPTWRGWRAFIRDATIAGLRHVFMKHHLRRLRI